MLAIVYSEFGAASDVLQRIELPMPEIKPGEVLVRLHSSGVNPSDTKARNGARAGAGSKPPFELIVPHSDGAGIIEAVGSGVDAARVGERVWIWNGQWRRAFGTAAEYIALPQQQAVLLPNNITFNLGATLGIPALTACHAVLGDGAVAGKNLLISGAAGTVAHIAVQIARLHGAKVIGTVSNQADAIAARAAGADHALNYKDDDLAEQILALTDGAGVDRIIEVEFGRNVATNSAVIKERGKIFSYGSAQAMTPQLPFYSLMFKAIQLELGLVYLLSEQQRSQAIAHLTAMLSKNQLAIRIHQVLPLAECARAHELIENERRMGSVILENI